MGSQRVKIGLIVLVLLQVLAAATAHLNITVRQDQRNQVSWLCRSDDSLSACRVTWVDYTRWGRGGPKPVLDLTDDTKNPHYSYLGAGLERSECGVRITLPPSQGYQRWAVGCWVRGSGGWRSAWTDIMTIDPPTEAVGITADPKEVVVLPGQDAIATCRVDEPLRSCIVGNAELNHGYVSANQEEVRQLGVRYFYHGEGARAGDCGVRIEEVGEEDNGVIACQVTTAYKELFAGKLIPIIVATPPTRLHLVVTYSDGEVRATCRTDGSRPISSLAWLLGGSTIRQDDLMDNPGSLWPWEKTEASQTIHWTPRPEDNGKLLSCEVSHAALRYTPSIGEVMVYSDPPKNGTYYQTLIIEDIDPTPVTESTTDSSTSTSTEPATSPTTEDATSPTTEDATSPTTEDATSPTTESTTSTTTESTTTTTEHPDTQCCCYVKRCYKVFQHDRSPITCTKTFTCQQTNICCPLI